MFVICKEVSGTIKNNFAKFGNRTLRNKIFSSQRNVCYKKKCGNLAKNNFILSLKMNNIQNQKFEINNSLSFNRRIPIVTILGRSNVGKSTLVNRLTGEFENGSIVFDKEGITRDRTYKKVFWRDYEFLVVDTGGLSLKKTKEEEFSNDVKRQALFTVQEASIALFMVDGKNEPNFEDLEIASFLRMQSIPVLLVVNKCENIQDFYLYSHRYSSLGLGTPIPISSLHGTNTGELLDLIVSKIPKVRFNFKESVLKVAIIGKPNAGKSSLLNFLTKKNRAIVSYIPGTTRDPLESFISGGPNCNIYNLVDTAGIRRKKSIDYGPEFFMINRSFKTITKADCVLLIIDANLGITEQDRKISERIQTEGKSCLILMNKWDLIKNKNNGITQSDLKKIVKTSLPSVSWAKILFTSTLTGDGCEEILEQVDSSVSQRNRHVSTSILNEIVQEATRWRPPSSSKVGKQGKIYYCTQISENPPTLSFFVNDPEVFSISYKRYMESQLRSALDFEGTPLRMVWIKRK